MSRVDKALSEIWYLASTKNLDKGLKQFEKRVAPVEFVFIGTPVLLFYNLNLVDTTFDKGVLLYVMRDYSHQDRAEAIYNMRTHIRKQFKDVRNNAHVGRALWLFVRSIMQPGSVSLDAAFATTSSQKMTKKRRKGGDDDDNEDDEYRPSPVRAFGTSTAKTRSKVAKR